MSADTGVGITQFTIWLLTRLRERGLRCAGYKPICCGDRSDRGEFFSSDFAADLRLPVIVIAHNRLGCLNHILLTVRSIEAVGLTCAGVVLNNLDAGGDIASTTNAATLQRCLRLPVLDQFADYSTEIPPALGQMLPELA